MFLLSDLLVFGPISPWLVRQTKQVVYSVKGRHFIVVLTLLFFLLAFPFKSTPIFMLLIKVLTLQAYFQATVETDTRTLFFSSPLDSSSISRSCGPAAIIYKLQSSATRWKDWLLSTSLMTWTQNVCYGYSKIMCRQLIKDHSADPAVTR